MDETILPCDFRDNGHVTDSDLFSCMVSMQAVSPSTLCLPGIASQ
jgi:hypothetical protein